MKEASTLIPMRLRPILAAAAFALALTADARAQDAERAAVIATVQKVFEAMKTRDTAVFAQVFDTSARLVGVSNRGGTSALTFTTPANFAAAIARAPADQVWNERIYDIEVKMDGDLAQVWTYYTFHMGSRFSHCGYDAFMLRKVGPNWKITQLADTRKTQGCTRTEPPGH